MTLQACLSWQGKLTSNRICEDMRPAAANPALWLRSVVLMHYGALFRLLGWLGQELNLHLAFRLGCSIHLSYPTRPACKRGANLLCFQFPKFSFIVSNKIFSVMLERKCR